MQCPKCNAMNQDGARFCSACGAALSAPPQPQFAQPPVQPAAQHPYGQPQTQQQNMQPQQPYPIPNQGATTSPASGKKKTGVVLAAILAALIVVIAGVFVAVRLFSAKPDPKDPSRTELPSDGLETTITTDGAPTTAPEQTAAPMNGAAEQDYSDLYGEWVDQGGRFDFYIRPDGTCLVASPYGSFPGRLEPSDGVYALKLEGDAGFLDNAALSLITKVGERSLRLAYGDGYTTLDFVQVPEKDELFDWVVIDFSSNMIDYYEFYDECRVDKSEHSEELMMVANYPLRDVKYLELELVDFAQDGSAIFKTKELYSQPVLLNRHPLLFDLTNAGDLPTRGVSFVDLDGVTHYVEISFSGEDGSVYYAEFNPG